MRAGPCGPAEGPDGQRGDLQEDSGPLIPHHPPREAEWTLCDSQLPHLRMDSQSQSKGTGTGTEGGSTLPQH